MTSNAKCDIEAYIEKINGEYQTGQTTEHSFRDALKELIEKISNDGIRSQSKKIFVINEPKRKPYGAPDFEFIRNGLTISFLETKNIGDQDIRGLNEKKHKKQFDRYKKAVKTIAFTNYLDFVLYEDGEETLSASVGNISNGEIRIASDEQQLSAFLSIIQRLIDSQPEIIRSSKVLAPLMAQKAHVLWNDLLKVLNEKSTQDDSKGQLLHAYEDLKGILLTKLDYEQFAKTYAQTVAYGLFAARLNADDSHLFNRDSAANLIPRNNKFVRGIFNELCGNNVHPAISWIIDDLVTMLSAADTKYMFEKDLKKDRDPLINFYENFLFEFDPKDKKNFGVYYTPIEIVRFIVKSIDTLLKEKLQVADGLANRDVIEHTVVDEQLSLPQVQILDPATGTGTFLAEVINLLADKYQGQEMFWQKYVHENLLPRLYGFEIQVASSTVAHIKLDLVLKKSGYVLQDDDVFNIRITNSLTRDMSKGGANTGYWISEELQEANKIKAQRPIMVMMGNPPYNGESENDTKELRKEIECYKIEPGFEESKQHIPDTKWLNNDYVQFIRLAEQYLESKGKGVLGFINPNEYLEGNTFRGMRYHLLRTFDEIYIIDLHGSSKLKEKNPKDGSKDENVFSIQIGVCINIFVKKALPEGEVHPKDKLARVFYAEKYGKRSEKLKYINELDFRDIQFKEVKLHSPMYYFVPIDFSHMEEFYEGFAPKDLFNIGGVGMCSKRDKIAYQDQLDDIRNTIQVFQSLTVEQLKEKYHIIEESQDAPLNSAKANVISYGNKPEYYKKLCYRPFDNKWTYFTDKSRGFIARPVYDVMKNLTLQDKEKNLGLIVGQSGRVVGDMQWNLAFVTDAVTDMNVFYRGGGYVYPLYVIVSDDETHADGSTTQATGKSEILPNLNKEILGKIEKRLGKRPLPEEILDYIYAMLYSEKYREKFAEFLKRDFPHIPYPTDVNKFYQLTEKGKELRKLHLMKDCNEWKAMQQYPCLGSGCNKIEERIWRNNRVYINKTQYYDNVPESVWNFHIGGYQVAEKWLKDHKNQDLSLDDVEHYSNVLYAINQTIKVMKEIDNMT